MAVIFLFEHFLFRYKAGVRGETEENHCHRRHFVNFNKPGRSQHCLYRLTVPTCYTLQERRATLRVGKSTISATCITILFFFWCCNCFVETGLVPQRLLGYVQCHSHSRSGGTSICGCLYSQERSNCLWCGIQFYNPKRLWGTDLDPVNLVPRAFLPENSLGPVPHSRVVNCSLQWKTFDCGSFATVPREVLATIRGERNVCTPNCACVVWRVSLNGRNYWEFVSVRCKRTAGVQGDNHVVTTFHCARMDLLSAGKRRPVWLPCFSWLSFLPLNSRKACPQQDPSPWDDKENVFTFGGAKLKVAATKYGNNFVSVWTHESLVVLMVRYCCIRNIYGLMDTAEIRILRHFRWSAEIRIWRHSVGQRSSPWLCKLGESRDKISSRLQAPFSWWTTYVATNAFTNWSESIDAKYVILYSVLYLNTRNEKYEW